MSDETEIRLLEETKKWLSRLEEKTKSMEITSILDKTLVKENGVDNIHAYIEDCKHFLEKKDLVNAFEAIIYAWGIFDSLRRLQLIEIKGDTDFT